MFEKRLISQPTRLALSCALVYLGALTFPLPAQATKDILMGGQAAHSNPSTHKATITKRSDWGTDSIVQDTTQHDASQIPTQVTMLNVNDWGSAFKGEATILNMGSMQIFGWIMSFEAEFEIQQIWNAKIISHIGKRYVGAWDGTRESLRMGREASALLPRLVVQSYPPNLQ
jgi:hypothetical protein